MTSITRALFVKIPDENRRAFGDHLLAKNVGRMVTVGVAMVVIQIIVHLINLHRYSAATSSYSEWYQVLSFMVLIASALFLALIAICRRRPCGRRAVWERLLLYGYVYTFLIIQLMFLTLDILNGQAVYAYYLGITVVGFAVILPPKVSAISIVSATAAMLALLAATGHSYLRADYAIQISTLAEIFILTLLTMVVSASLYNMTARDFLIALALARNQADLEAANEQLMVLASTDQLTGARNRTAYSRESLDLIRSFSPTQRGAALAMIDVDFFKSYNDTFGHQAGDECLKAVAGSLRRSFARREDVVYRFGGEEFLIIYPTDREHAFELADRARKNLEELKLPHANHTVSPYVTISVGVCFLPDPGALSDPDEPLRLADQALYASKSNGRNRTTVAPLARLALEKGGRHGRPCT